MTKQKTETEAAKPKVELKPAMEWLTKSGTGKRVVSGIISFLVFLFLIFYVKYLFAVAVLALILVGTFEFYRMTERLQTNVKKGAIPALAIPVLLWLTVMASHFKGESNIEMLAWVVILGLMLSQLLVLSMGRFEQFSIKSAINFFTGLYVALPLCLLLHLYLYYTPKDGSFLGARLILFLLIPTWASDTAAYFVGRKFGKNKLSPTLSPAKTVEGFLGGLAASIIASFLFWSYFLTDIHFIFGASMALFVGLVVGVFGPVGDLSESALKREARVKDSGTFLPGHGGALDRIDSILFSSVFFFWACYSRIPVEAALLVR
jgi:phosphatidate cytidylyltransferase